VLIIVLQSWDWQYGQTPEFTHSLSGSFPFGSLVRLPSSGFFVHISSRSPPSPSQDLTLASRHGLITSASLPSPVASPDWSNAANELCSLLEGEQYETVEGVAEKLEGKSGEEAEKLRLLVDWVKGEMR
jgi:lipoate-protein ligase A